MRPNARPEGAFPLIEGVVDKYRLRIKTIDTMQAAACRIIADGGLLLNTEERK
jgi:hypothetical protein